MFTFIYFYLNVLCSKMHVLRDKFIIYYKIMKMCVMSLYFSYMYIFSCSFHLLIYCRNKKSAITPLDIETASTWYSCSFNHFLYGIYFRAVHDYTNGSSGNICRTRESKSATIITARLQPCLDVPQSYFRARANVSRRRCEYVDDR